MNGASKVQSVAGVLTLAVAVGANLSSEDGSKSDLPPKITSRL